MKSYPVQLAVTAVFALAAELLIALYTKALMGGFMLPGMGISFALRALSFVAFFWFDEMKWWKRAAFVLVDGLGDMLGTMIVMECWP